MSNETTDPLVTALLIEDDDRLARLTSDYLTSHGLAVSLAADGSRGLEQALRVRYDVVLLDLMFARQEWPRGVPGSPRAFGRAGDRPDRPG